MSLVGIATAVGIGGAAIGPAQAASLTRWQYDSATNQLELTLKDGTTPRYFLMAQPARIVVDLPNTSIGTADTQKTYTGAVRQIRVSQFQAGLTRIVMELSPDASLAPGQVKLEKGKSESHWVVQPLLAQAPATTAAIAKKPFQPGKPIGTVSFGRLPAPSVSPPKNSVPNPSTAVAATLPASRAKPVVSSGQNSVANSSVSVTSPLPTTLNSASKPAPDLKASPPPDTSVASSSRETDPFPAVPNPLSAPATTVQVPTLPVNRPSPQMIAKPAGVKPAPMSTAAAKPEDGIAVDTTNGVTIAVPAPEARSTPATVVVSLPTTTPAKLPTIQPAPSLPASLPPKAASPQVAFKPSPPAAMTTNSAATPSIDAALEIPSTIVSRSSRDAIITVPPLSSARVESAPNATISPAPSPPARSFPQPTVSNPSPAPLSELPSTAIGADQPATVSVPAMSPNKPIQPGTSTAGADGSTLLPPDVPSLAATPTPTIAAANSAVSNRPRPTSAVMATGYSNAGNTSAAPTVPTQPSVVEFGQKLPTAPTTPTGSGSSRLQSYRPVSPDTLLPAGTLLELRYPGENALNVKPGEPQQEVLVLQTEVRDSSGNVILPTGTRVIGRFEATSAGSRFVAQAITLGGRAMPIAAQSESLGGTRSLSEGTLARNAGIGVLAGGLIGGLTGGENTGWGVIGGAAAGAAATYFTAPKPATIQPGQVLQIRLEQDLRQR